MPFVGKSLDELKKELATKEIDWTCVGPSKSLIEK